MVLILTERLILDELTPADAGDMFPYRADPEVCRFQSWEPMTTLEEVERFIAQINTTEFNTPGTWFQIAIRHHETGQLLGDIAIHFLTDAPQQVELGFTISSKCQRQGYATEAVQGLLQYLFQDCEKHRVTASVDPRNHASLALLQKVGFKQEAHFRKSLWFKGEWVDDIIYAILRSEFPSPSKQKTL
jgi:RimJ/RimL family protein N-acetyltransferase